MMTKGAHMSALLNYSKKHKTKGHLDWYGYRVFPEVNTVVIRQCQLTLYHFNDTIA